jgi:hypothetical protein
MRTQSQLVRVCVCVRVDGRDAHGWSCVAAKPSTWQLRNIHELSGLKWRAAPVLPLNVTIAAPPLVITDNATILYKVIWLLLFPLAVRNVVLGVESTGCKCC